MKAMCATAYVPLSNSGDLACPARGGAPHVAVSWRCPTARQVGSNPFPFPDPNPNPGLDPAPTLQGDVGLLLDALDAGPRLFFHALVLQPRALGVAQARQGTPWRLCCGAGGARRALAVFAV